MLPVPISPRAITLQVLSRNITDIPDLSRNLPLDYNLSDHHAHEIKSKLNNAKQRSAISPNYVHSLDASALMLTVQKSLTKNLRSFAMIHDSYGTLAADSETLAITLREVFLYMFGGDTNHLEMWLREVLAPLPVALQADAPLLPSMGALDVNEVKNAPFFFA